MLEIRFHKEERHTWWEATRGRSRIDGAVFGGPPAALPHDLVGLVVERHLGVPGFWWAVDRGATFRSMRKRPTRPGRAVVREHADRVRAAERAVHEVDGAWRRGEPTPASAELDRLAAEWAAVPVGGSLDATYVGPAGGRGRAPRRASPRPRAAPARAAAGRRRRS